jgi:hypothetical protein
MAHNNTVLGNMLQLLPRHVLEHQVETHSWQGGTMTLSDSRPGCQLAWLWGTRPPPKPPPTLPEIPFRRAVPTTPVNRTVLLTVSSRPMLPSPLFRRVGVHHFTFEACSGFTRVTARRMARSPKATLVTRLQCAQLPVHTARQLPDLPSIIWVEPSSTGISRHRGALNNAG